MTAHVSLQISPALIGALQGYKAGGGFYSVPSWEGWEHLQGLHSLELWLSNDLYWKGCPKFPSLKKLILVGDRLPYAFSAHFPALESVTVIGLHSDFAPDLLENLQTMPSIRNISLKVMALSTLLFLPFLLITRNACLASASSPCMSGVNTVPYGKRVGLIFFLLQYSVSHSYHKCAKRFRAYLGLDCFCKQIKYKCQ